MLIDLAEVSSGRGHIPKEDVIGKLRRFEEIEEIMESKQIDRSGGQGKTANLMGKG